MNIFEINKQGLDKIATFTLYTLSSEVTFTLDKIFDGIRVDYTDILDASSNNYNTEEISKRVKFKHDGITIIIQTHDNN